jgi:hypothetical protein
MSGAQLVWAAKGVNAVGIANLLKSKESIQVSYVVEKTYLQRSLRIGGGPRGSYAIDDRTRAVAHAHVDLQSLPQF